MCVLMLCLGRCLINLSFTAGGRGHAEEDRSGVRKPPSQWKVSDLDIVLSEPAETREGPQLPQGGDSKTSECLEKTKAH